jgi:23S rRNA (cytosine1962-C5)-methyltransferase
MEIFLNKKNAKSFSGFHPWVLDRSVIEPTSQPAAGQMVDLVSANGSWIGRGFYNPNSRIRVRLYQWRKESKLDELWLFSQLENALTMRERWMSRRGRLDCVRWVNSEGDGLSGLIIDQFGDYLVVQVNALAMLAWEQPLIDWLKTRLHPRGIFLRVDQTTASAEGIEQRDQLVFGTAPQQPIEVTEGPVRLLVDLVQSQKTGYYLDQRSNRQRAAQWMGNGPMLDICCYLGGFSLTAQAIAQPSSITAVDTSHKILEQADRNAKLNLATIEFVQADCFDYLNALNESNKQFETIVLDPPKMASNRSQIQSALRAYHRLNLTAVNLIEPGGILVTCSCSGRISRTDFIGMLAAVAHRSRRSIQVLETLGADFDHPVHVHCPETEYLKCFVCRVI